MKKTYVAFMLALVFLTISAMPSLAADTQAAYAKIPDDLLDAFANTDERLDVVVWLEDESTDEYQSIVANIPEPDFSTEETDVSEYGLQNIADTELTKEERLAQIEQMQNYIMQKRQIAQAVYLEDNNAVAAQLESELGDGEIVYISRYSPLIICNINLSEAMDIAMNNSVMSLTNGNEIMQEELEYSLPSISATSTIAPGYSAEGIIIGMIEPNVPNVLRSSFSEVRSKIEIVGTSTTTSDHASLVAAIIVNAAPDFEKLLCIGIDSYTSFYSAIETLLSNGVNVINMSAGYEANLNSYDARSKWMDHIAYNHSVHFVKSAGNDGTNRVSSPGMAYNIITVGNIFDNNNTNTMDDVRVLSSSYNSNCDTLAFKPDICAPGQRIDIPDDGAFLGYDNINEQYYDLELSGGTSFAAPHVTSVVAALCSYHPTLLTKQALMKSILMNTVACNTFHRYDTSVVTGDIAGFREYGAGIVNAYNAMQLIDSGNYINDGMAASKSVVTYSLGTLQAGQTVSVTLAILKRARIVSGSHTNNPTITESELPNMDLHIRSATAPANIPHYLSNEDNNNNVQKLIFTATTTDEYLIVINKTGGDDTYETLYAVSWMVDSDNMQ